LRVKGDPDGPSNLLAAILVVGVTLADGASARGGGGAGGGAPSGAQAAAHANSRAVQNSNAPFAADRDKGLQRAEDRRSVKGNLHEPATRQMKK